MPRQAVKRNASLSASDRISAIVKSMETVQKADYYCMADMRMEEELAVLRQTQKVE